MPDGVLAVRDKTLLLLEFDTLRKRLADRTRFGGGRELALGLEPAWEGEAVAARQALTAQARDFLDRRGGALIEGAHDMRLEIESATRGKMLLARELLEIRDTIAAARRVKRPIVRDGARWPELAALAERIDPCPGVHDAIQDALDDDGEVRDSASPELRRLRRKRRVVHDRIVRQMEGLLRGSAASHLQEALITQRDGRYVLPIKADFRGRVPGVVHDVSDSGQTVFVEPLSVVELGNEHRQLELEERKEVERILRELTACVAEEAQALVGTVGELAAIDLVFAKARLGIEMRAVRPEIELEGRPGLRFLAARHPLLDPDTVVPIDVWVGADEDFHVLVITGPNTGGKTVSLKTVGLLAVMAQAGLQVPAADGARLSVFDGVFADIGDEQSIEQSLSTFSGHMTNIIAVLEQAGERSLVLLDELGAGTDPAEGAALAGAILETLRARDVATVASTHYTELKSYAYATEGVANASVEFDVDSLRPTYELTIGLPGRSNALAIATRLGLPAHIVDRAREGLAVSEIEMEDLLAEIREARRSSTAERVAATEQRVRAEAWAARLEKALREIEEERAELLNTARRQAEGELEAARRAIRRLLQRAERTGGSREALAEARGALDAKVEELADIVAEREQAEVVAPPPEPELLAPGARVRVRSLSAEGEVLELDERKEEVLVQLGALRMRVDLEDLEWIAAPATARPVESSGRHQVDTGAASPVELDLRGMRVEEALGRVDEQLDRALLIGSPFIRIVHGHGTGALKKAIREALRRHPSVTRHRAGERGEGGDGATVVYFD